MPSIDPAVMRRLVAGSRVARMATLDADGRPHLVPLVFAMDGDTLYSSVDEKPKTTRQVRRLGNIRANPDRVTVLIDHYEDDWPAVWWVRLRGTGRVLEEGAERERALRLLAEKYPQYRDMPPQGAVIALGVTEWRGWSWRPLQ
ncbi:MAG TPA: TIGR03668 family PPOX class F420-dependent oxidoreductase, partial [Actinomycetota bacterium]|nr:TIGR03668 family PPOX class F420-dependent oxidoreductase [Actinomycetota bacterium]